MTFGCLPSLYTSDASMKIKRDIAGCLKTLWTVQGTALGVLQLPAILRHLRPEHAWVGPLNAECSGEGRAPLLGLPVSQDREVQRTMDSSWSRLRELREKVSLVLRVPCFGRDSQYGPMITFQSLLTAFFLSSHSAFSCTFSQMTQRLSCRLLLLFAIT